MNCPSTPKQSLILLPDIGTNTRTCVGTGGIFANASLFHVPTQELERVLSELHASLKPGGVLLSSNPRGDNREGWNGQRYGAYHDLEHWRALLTAAGFTELEHYYRPTGLPRDQQPWLVSVWRK